MKRLNRLAHSFWDCKYHISWIPKYRRKELYGAKRRIEVDTIKQWARIKGIEIIEGHVMSDHIHLCVSIPPKYSVANTIGLLKGRSAFGLDKETIQEYIRNQEKMDMLQEEPTP